MGKTGPQLHRSKKIPIPYMGVQWSVRSPDKHSFQGTSKTRVGETRGDTRVGGYARILYHIYYRLGVSIDATIRWNIGF